MVKTFIRDNTTKSDKVSLVTLIVLWGASFVALINSIVLVDWMKIGLAVAALLLYFLPILMKLKWKIHLSAILEITYYLFIFASMVLGEVFAFYGPYPFWDIILHFLSGFMLAGIGFSLIRNVKKDRVSKILVLIFAFCFSVTLGTIWECVEFTFDTTIRTDAQKDAHLQSISTITMQRDGGNQPVKIDNIDNIDINLKNGETIKIEEGYLDIGLMDTMKDILINIAGAVLFCFVGAIQVQNDKKGFVDNFAVTLK